MIRIMKRGTKRCDAVAAGHICLDIIPELPAAPHGRLDELLRPGRLTQVGPATLCTGGAVSNTGLVLHRLGLATRLAGKIGADAFGGVIRSIVTARGGRLADGMIEDAGAATSYTVILNPPGIDRMFLHCPGANDTFCAGDVPYDAVADARLFHFGYPSLMRRMFEREGRELAAMMRRVKRLGVTTSLDLSFPDSASPAGHADWRAILRAAMPFVDVFMPNFEETLFMLRRERFDALYAGGGEDGVLAGADAALLRGLAGELLGWGARVVGLKLGHRGLYVRTAEGAAMEAIGAARPRRPREWAGREIWAPCFRVRVAGTTGAGDATVAGFLAALLRGCALPDAVTAAVAVGACNVEAPDALGGIRTWEETMRRISRGWKRRPMPAPGPDWTRDRVSGAWERP